MAAEWKKYKLGELCYSVSETYRRHDDKVVLINTSDVLNGKILNHEEVENKNLKGQFKKTFKQNDILYSEIRPANKRFAYVDIENPFNYIASTKLMVLRSTGKILPKFLFILLTSEQIITYLQAMAETRSGTFPQITYGAELAPIIVNVPDIETQEKIVKILSALDEKIELNNKINENLHAQAQAIFKSWFVDFENIFDKKNSFFGEIPSDFFVKTIGELPIYIADYVANGSFASLKKNVILYNSKEYAYFIRNTDLKSNSFDVYVDEHSYNFLNKSKLFGGEVIISNVGDVGSVFLCPKLDLPMTLGNNVIMLRPECDYLVYYVYLWFKYFYGKELIKSITGGSAQPKFNKTDFKRLPVIVPTENMLMKFNQVISPIFKKIIINEMENKKLAQIRDTLLPKLMRGELEV